MRNTPKWLSTGLECCGALLVLVSLPLLALAMFVLRAVLVAAALAALATGLLLYAFSPRFRGWLGRLLVGPRAALRVVSLPTGRLQH